MAETTPPAQGTGVIASVTSAFKDLVNQATPLVSSYLDYRAARENSKPSAVANYAGAGSGAGSPPATQGAASITSAKWFPFAIVGAVLAVVGILVFALSGRRK